MNYKEHIEGLEGLLKNSKDLYKIADYFLTHLGENKHFVELGEHITEHEVLSSIALKIIGRLFKKQFTSTQLFLNKVPASDFIHGTCLIEHCYLTTLIYFEKSKLGLLTTAFPGEETHFFRFTAATIKEPHIPYYGPPISA